MKETIHRFSKAVGLRPETIRYYREMGLLHPEIQSNGFYYYDQNDAIITLMIRELKAYDFSLDTIKESMQNQTIEDIVDQLKNRETSLIEQIRQIELELSRMKETRIYTECGLRLRNCVEEFNGPATWAVPFNEDSDHFCKTTQLNQWSSYFPFVYASLTIPQDQLISRQENTPFSVKLGLGSLIHYVEKFKLPLDSTCLFQPGGHFIRTCIIVRDINHITPQDCDILYQYVHKRHYRFASCTGGRILFVEHADTEPLFHLLIWVRVEPENPKE